MRSFGRWIKILQARVPCGPASVEVTLQIFKPPLFIALAALGLLVVLSVLVQILSRRRKTQEVATVYEAIPELLTSAERSFFGVLQQTVTPEYQIFAKVRLADIVRPVRGSSGSDWQSAFNRIAGKHVDFVLCAPSSLTVIAVIELDDRTHERTDRGIRDSLVNSALADARIPILRVPARQSYSAAQIREQVLNLVRPPMKATAAND